MTDGAIGTRKGDHLALCATGDVGFRAKSTLLECVQLVHDALPELDHGAIDLGVTLFGKTLKAPLLIAGMTGGTEEAKRINLELAEIAEQLGIGFGLGSQRAMHVRPETAATYQVRRAAKTTLVLGNVGGVQARAMSDDELRGLVEAVGADALCVHLNPAMELIQPNGDRDFRAIGETLARVVERLGKPVIAKETGSGIGPRAAAKIAARGVRHVDVSGAGGTSWVAVETHRARRAGDGVAADLGEALWDWGIPTAASVVACAGAGFETVIATGGIARGTDVARAIALGAHAAGIARPVLQAHHDGGKVGAITFLDGVLRELRAVMLLTGSATVADLRSAPRVLTGELTRWLSETRV